MMSISTTLLSHNSLSHQTWSIDINIRKSKNFQESFEQFGGLGLDSGPFSI